MPKTFDDYLNDPRLKDEPEALRLTHAMRFKVQDDIAEMTPEEENAYHSEKAKSAFSRLGITPKYTTPYYE